MIFSLILLVLMLAIGYFHYAQGLFTATLSAILAVFAAVLAVGCHEAVAQYFYLKCPEIADGLALVGIFAVAYVVPRLLLDQLIPGNVRFPALVDKIGAGAMGVIAGLFATGIFALAAETLPFGPTIGGYARQDLRTTGEKDIHVPSSSNGARSDSGITDQMIGDSLTDPAHLSHLWFRQDEMVVALTQQLSDTGAFSWQQPFSAVHPDYVTELFGQRIGIQVGAKTVAIDTDTSTPVKEVLAYIVPRPQVMDAEIQEVRDNMKLPTLPPDMKLVAIEVTFSSNPDLISDTDQLIRISCADVRLKQGDADYYPLGTLVDRKLLLANRIDDPLAIDAKSKAQTVDFLFAVPIDSVTATREGKSNEQVFHFQPGAFLEVKRYARQELDKPILATPPASTPANGADGESLGGVLRKRIVKENALKELNETSGVPATPAATAAPTPTPTPATPAPEPSRPPRGGPGGGRPGRGQ